MSTRTRPQGQASPDEGERSAPDRWTAAARWSAALGAALWLGLAWAPLPLDVMTGTITRLLMMGPLVMVPLALALVATPAADGSHVWMYRAAVATQPVAAIIAMAALYQPQGALAALLVVPWLGVTGLLALFGLWRVANHRLARIEEVCLDSALIYIPVGGVWMIASRLGFDLMGFDQVIVLLTAVHFHYAGFTAPLIVGLAGRAVPDERKTLRTIYWLGALAVIAGPPLIAIGITVSPLLEVICAVLLAVGLLVVSGVMMLGVGPGLKHPIAWALLSVSALSLVVTMALACMYAWGEFSGTKLITIPRMAEVHGVVNVVGFSLCGLIAWALVRPDSRVAAPPVADWLAPLRADR